MTNPETFDDLVESVRAMFFALRTVSERLLADLDCTAAERGVLQEIERLGPQTVPALALARGITRQAMQRTIEGLLARQRLSEEDNPRHVRSPLLALTPVGKRLLTDIRARERRLLASTELPVSAAELQRTTRVLDELAAFIGHIAPRARP
ncbi:MAG TPA: MarR family winged helix-turn-helix transcriptional regulator [Polyangia bacterium]|nr:MarR family winged helix-turn-helix transcriptional regulator [Polyangia bacterium]